MKHLFFVHTHITYYVSKAIISKFEIAEKEILMVYSRNYSNSVSQLNGINVSDISKSLLKLSYWRVGERERLIKELDNKLHLDKERFKAYLPHVADPVMQAIARHSLCTEVNFIEEGANCYSKAFYDIRKDTKWMIKKIINGLDLNKKSRFQLRKPFELDKKLLSKTRNYFTISPNGFSYAKGAPIQVLNLIPEPISYSLRSNAIFIFEAAIENKQIHDSEVYFDSIKKMFSQATKTYALDTISYKFHPAQDINVKSQIIEIGSEIFKESFIIPNDIPFEQILLNHKNLLVLGFTSSLLYYASILGNEVHSYEDLILRDTGFKSYRKFNDFDIKNLINQNVFVSRLERK